MTVLSAQTIAIRGILTPCEPRTEEYGLTYGLGPCGYDLRLDLGPRSAPARALVPGQFLLAATVERFSMPDDVMGRVCDKSTLARRGLSVFNTVIEPGWRGFLTLELVNHGAEPIMLKQGQAIAQVLFEFLDYPTAIRYEGKYQDQEAGPQPARE